MAVCENTLHLGVPRTIEVAGFSDFNLRCQTFSDLNGLYDLRVSDPEPVWHQRPKTLNVRQRPDPVVPTGVAISRDSLSRWSLFCDDGREIPSHRGGETPLGNWHGLITVEMRPTGLKSEIDKLAFPAPNPGYSFYAEELVTDGVTYPPLLKSEHFLVLQTAAGQRVPALHVRRPEAHFTLLYSHGNSEDLGMLLEECQDLARGTGADVLAYDYIGYSLSGLEGEEPSERNCYESIDAAWTYLTVDLHLPAERIVLYGRSIGSGPTIQLAIGRAALCAGVILACPITSGARVFLRSAGRLFRKMDIFLNCEKIQKIKQQVAIMHGMNDRVVGVWNGKSLWEQLSRPHPPLWLENCGHDDMPADRCHAYMAGFLTAIKQDSLTAVEC